MTQPLRALGEWERMNFLLTNRIPRGLATRFMGWLSRVENPWLTRLLIGVWRLFADDLNLAEAQKREFRSLHECFTRELRDGARVFATGSEVICSPSDGVVGAYGDIHGMEVFQAKGFPYELGDLIPDAAVRERYRDGVFVTLRLKSSMYHRFHAPMDCRLDRVVYISGDTWNVNPVALKRIEKLYCKNERAGLELWDEQGGSICLVPVAAIRVASIYLPRPAIELDSRYGGPRSIPCNEVFVRGEELGYFQHGSTIILFAPQGYRIGDGLRSGSAVRAGDAIFRRPGATAYNGCDNDPNSET